MEQDNNEAKSLKLPVEENGGASKPEDFANSPFWSVKDVDAIFEKDLQETKNTVNLCLEKFHEANDYLVEVVEKTDTFVAPMESNTLFLGNYDGENNPKSYGDLDNALSFLHNNEVFKKAIEQKLKVIDLYTKYIDESLKFDYYGSVYEKLNRNIRIKHAKAEKEYKDHQEKMNSHRVGGIVCFILPFVGILFALLGFFIGYDNGGKYVYNKGNWWDPTTISFGEFVSNTLADKPWIIALLSLWSIILFTVGAFMLLDYKEKKSKPLEKPRDLKLVLRDFKNYFELKHRNRIVETNETLSDMHSLLDEVAAKEKEVTPYNTGSITRYFSSTYMPYLEKAMEHVHSGRCRTLKELLDQLDLDENRRLALEKQEDQNRKMINIALQTQQEQRQAQQRLEEIERQKLAAAQAATRAEEDAANYAKQVAEEAKKQTKIAERDSKAISKTLRKL